MTLVFEHNGQVVLCVDTSDLTADEWQILYRIGKPAQALKAWQRGVQQ